MNELVRAHGGRALESHYNADRSARKLIAKAFKPKLHRSTCACDTSGAASGSGRSTTLHNRPRRRSVGALAVILLLSRAFYRKKLGAGCAGGDGGGAGSRRGGVPAGSARRPLALGPRRVRVRMRLPSRDDVSYRLADSNNEPPK